MSNRAKRVWCIAGICVALAGLVWAIFGLRTKPSFQTSRMQIGPSLASIGDSISSSSKLALGSGILTGPAPDAVQQT